VEQEGDRPEAGPGDESGLEAAVKGIGQHIAGRFKEVAGELLEDPQLEEQGIAERIEGDMRRAKAAAPEEAPTPPPPEV
jgi:uncharacterized protein YjbJ (UPF0337 family)